MLKFEDHCNQQTNGCLSELNYLGHELGKSFVDVFFACIFPGSVDEIIMLVALETPGWIIFM